MVLHLKLSPFKGRLWRLVPCDRLDAPAAPASAPEGRFHHSGQVATYASLSAEGARVAMERYLADGVERSLVSLRFAAERIVDARYEAAATTAWQAVRAGGERPASWVLSDVARELGADGMLYHSRSRSDLLHMVIFKPRLLQVDERIYGEDE